MSSLPRVYYFPHEGDPGSWPTVILPKVDLRDLGCAPLEGMRVLIDMSEGMEVEAVLHRYAPDFWQALPDFKTLRRAAEGAPNRG